MTNPINTKNLTPELQHALTLKIPRTLRLGEATLTTLRDHATTRHITTSALLEQIGLGYLTLKLNPAPEDPSLATYNEWRKQQGLRPVAPVDDNKRVVVFSLSTQAQAGLQALALAHGYMHGDKPSINALLEAFGQGNFILAEAINE